MFNSWYPSIAIQNSGVLKVGAILYLPGVIFFADYYWRHKKWLILVFWLLFNASLVLNAVQYIFGNEPPIYQQYSQSTLLLIYAGLLLLNRTGKPNWLRIFALVNLIVLLPCLFFYFKKNWQVYEIFVYVLCFTPILKGLVFTHDLQSDETEILDLE